MIHLKSLIESAQFSNWKVPSQQDLKREFHVEHELKGNTYFENEDAFLDACKRGKITSITSSMDAKIAYRSRTKSFNDLLSLIKGYRSYPTYRNEDTLKGIYDAFKNNGKMDLPIVLQSPSGRMRIFSGNTRLDIAFQLGITPKALVIQTDSNL